MSKIATGSPQTVPSLTLLTLGRWRLMPAQAAPDAAQFGPSKPLALLVYLALSPGRTALREHLIDLLWADRDPAAAANAFRQTVWFIRRRLGESTVVTDGASLILAAATDIDRDAFLAAVQRQDYEEALRLYHGDFLPGFAAPGGAEFERWADVERYRLRGMFVRSALSLARVRLSEGKAREAVRIAKRARETDPLSEPSWRLLLESLVAAGDAIGAATEADALGQLLATESREPEPATRLALRAARQEPPADAPGDGAAQLVAELIGRETEFSATLAAWERVRRGSGAHVHVVAPAGLGKTRMLTDVHARLRGTGAHAIAVRANPGDRAIPYALLSELAFRLAALPGAKGISPGAAATLLRLHPGLASVFSASQAGPPQSRDDTALHRSLALAELVAAVAEEAPLALLIDDLHWADDASGVALSSVLERAAALRVLVVTTSRPRPETSPTRIDTQTLTLVPLTAGHIRELLTSIAQLPDADWTDELVAGLERSTHGSPLLLLETLQLSLDQGLLRRDDAGCWACDDPSALDTLLSAGGALRRRVAELSRNHAWMMLLLALDGVPVPALVLETAIPRPPDAIAADLMALEQRGLIVRAGEGWVPAHDEIACEILAGANAEALRAAHEGLGQGWRFASSFEGSAKRATAHLLESGDTVSLGQFASRRIRDARRAGDGRHPRTVTRDLLTTDPAGVQTILRALPWSQRVGLDRPWRKTALAVGITATLAGALTLEANRLTPPDATLDVALTDTSGTPYEVLEPLRSLPPGDVTLNDWQPASPAIVPLATRGINPPRFDTHGDLSAIGLATDPPDSGVIDIYIQTGENRRRLTFGIGDDNADALSADARFVAGSTARGQRWFDIALFDVASGRIRLLTSNSAHETTARLSPDMTRVAFIRYDPQSEGSPHRRLCIAPTAGGWDACSPVEGLTSIPGWLDDDRILIVAADTMGQSRFATVDADGLGVEAPDIESYSPGIVITADVSPNGRFLVARMVAREGEAPEWILADTDHPGSARRLIIAGHSDLRIAGAAWRTWQARPYLARIRLDPPSRIAIGGAHRLTVSGLDDHGRPIPVRGAVWQSADTAVAGIDSRSGIVIAKREGPVWIRVHAGYDLADSTLLDILPALHQTRFTERWDGAAAWRLFGTPMADLGTGPGGVKGLLTNGDSSFTSGAYTRQAFSSASGLGIEFMASLPLNANQWQVLNVGLTPDLDDSMLARWDHRTGGVPQRAGLGEEACSFALPEELGATGAPHVVLSAGGLSANRAVQPSAIGGAWHTFLMQILPDGRCGLAMDGRPLLILDSRLDPAMMRVMLSGYSFHTRIMVGPLSVWTGVRDDIHWLDLEHDDATQDTVDAGAAR